MSKEELQDYQWLACLPQVLDFEKLYLDIYLEEISGKQPVYVENEDAA